MTIEGLKQFEAVRDFLYSKMRGVKDDGSRAAASPAAFKIQNEAELAQVLREITDELRGARKALERRQGAEKEPNV
jgi:putative membrane protein